MLFGYWQPLLLFMAAAGGWHEERTRMDAKWQARWDAHGKLGQKAAAACDARARAEEQRRQQSINKVIEDGQRNIDQVRANASAAADQRMRDAPVQYAGRIAAAEAGRDSCTAAASKAVARHARVLAELLGKADRLASVHAEAADKSRVRGLACEAAYDSLRGEGAQDGRGGAQLGLNSGTHQEISALASPDYRCPEMKKALKNQGLE